MKWKITKDEYEALPEHFKDEYKLSGDSATLTVDGLDTKAAEKFEAERTRRRDAEKARDKAVGELETFKDGDDRPALVAKYEKDLAKEKKRAEDAEGKFTNHMRSTTLNSAAQDLAQKLSPTNAKILMPHILSRLDVDMTDPSAPKAIVLKDGKPSEATLDDLRKEMVADKDFAGIVVASQATGGAASKQADAGRRGLPTAPGNPPTSGATTPNLGDMPAKDLAARIRANRVAQGLEG
jgi:hypothetical protein